MELRRATGLLLCALLTLPGLVPVRATDGSAPAPAPAASHAIHPHVTARPPLQAIPATSANADSVQLRMRQCNGLADARRLKDAPRESYIKVCMSTHRVKRPSRAGSEPQHGP